MATYPVYDENGEYKGDYEWCSIPVLFKDNWYLEKGVFHLGKPGVEPLITLRDEVTDGVHAFTRDEFEEAFGFAHTPDIRTVQDVINVHRRARADRVPEKRLVRPGGKGKPKRAAFDESRVVRDRNGCFLGVFTIREATSMWPCAKSSGSLIVVPETVSFADAAKSVAATKSNEIPFSQRRYRDSVKAARRFANDHIGESAAEHWKKSADRSVSIVNNRDEPIGRVTPRMLARTLGDGWFMVDDNLAQAMTAWSAKRVADALRPVLEDSNLMDDVTTSGMRHIRDMGGDIIVTCDAEAFDRIYKNLIRRLPEGSYIVGGDGLQLSTGYDALGFGSRFEFADACAKASADRPTRSTKASERDGGERGFVVMSSDGRTLYQCGARRARMVRPYVEEGLPKKAYERTADGIRLLVSLEQIRFKSKNAFAVWCSKCDPRKTVRMVASGGRSQANVHDSSRREVRSGAGASFSGPEHVLHVFKGTIACRRRGHRIESVTGTIVTLGCRELRINANWCKDCGMYFLGRGEYMHYRELYGPILGNFRFDGAEYSLGDGFGALADESPLMLCGYSVSEAEGLSERERRLILANVMDRGICPKHRVIEYLQFFIRSRRNHPRMSNARAKWQADLEWVRGYHIDSQRRFTVSEVRRFR